MSEISISLPPVSTVSPTLLNATQESATQPGIRYGRFALQRFHAKGGLGEVHVAVDGELGREVALKRIQEQYATNEAAQRRFLNEAEITAQLEHPGVVPIHGLVHDDQGQPCYAMRFIAGESLAEAIKRFHRQESATASLARASGSDFTSLPFRQLLQRFINVCQTMAYAHSKQIIHRDLKPANIMLGPYGETLVVDWGLAKRVVRDQKSEFRDEAESLPTTVDFERSSTDDHVYTKTGQVLGTAGYMSPEQAAGNLDEVDAASDVYSLGATLYELLTGQRPLRGHNFFVILQRTQSGDLPSARQLQPAIPKALEAICQKAMALAPDHRYHSASALAADLEQWLADEPVSAYAEPWPLRARRWLRRHRTLALSSAIAVLGLVVVLIVVLVLVEQHRQQLTTEKDNTEQQRQTAVAAVARRNQFIEDVFDEETIDALKRQRELTPKQKDFLRNMLQHYQELVREPPRDAWGRERLARAYFKMALGCQALGRAAEAVPAYRQVIDLYEKLATEFPDESRYRRDLARAHHNVGLVQKELGQPAAAAAFRHALVLQEKLAADFPTDAVYRQDVARTHTNLGGVLNDLGEDAASEAAYRRALELQEKLAIEFPALDVYRHELADSHHNLGVLLRGVGRQSEAEAAFRHALTLQETLVAETPTQVQYRQDLALTQTNLGTVLARRGELSAAETAFRQALELRKKLAAEYPAFPEYHLDLARSHYNLGILLKDQEQRPKAEDAFRRALALQEKLAAEFPTVPGYRQELAASCLNLGLLQSEQGRPEASLPWYTRSIALLDSLLQTAGARQLLRNALWSRAEALDKLVRPADAVKDWTRALDCNDDPAMTRDFRLNRALSLARAGQHAEAFAESNKLAEAHVAKNDTLYALARICALAAAAVKDNPSLQEQYAARAVALLRQAVAKGFKNMETLKQHEDFMALRDRADFKQLLHDVEKTMP